MSPASIERQRIAQEATPPNDCNTSQLDSEEVFNTASNATLGLAAGTPFDLDDWLDHEMSGYDQNLEFGLPNFLPESTCTELPSDLGTQLLTLTDARYQSASTPPAQTSLEHELLALTSMSAGAPVANASSGAGDRLESPESAGKQRPKKHGSAGLLQTFYRLSLPRQVFGMGDEDFVSHYFSHVCPLISVFDSDDNPFRTLVDKTWRECETVYLAAQSMAVGHLTNFYPYLAPLGITKRTQAWKTLHRDLQRWRSRQMSLDPVMLALLLLGLSSAWHRASNIGLPYLTLARGLMQAQFDRPDERRYHVSPGNEDYFSSSMIYWEMLATFVDPVPVASFAGPTPDLTSKPGACLPHPWLAVCTEAYFALAEVGRVLRRRYSLDVAGAALRSQTAEVQRLDEDWAGNLERYLQAVRIPPVDEILEYRDPATPVSDLIATSKAYRLAGLLEIYDAFPAILRLV
jgi:hypothetical protein